MRAGLFDSIHKLQNIYLNSNIVEKAIDIFEKCTEKGDVLIPMNISVLHKDLVCKKRYKDSAFLTWNYKWNPGRYGEFEDNYNNDATIKKDTIIDRIGPDTGVYASPLKNKPYLISNRAIPYYLPYDDITEAPSYHKYIVKKDISRDILINDDCIKKGIYDKKESYND